MAHSHLLKVLREIFAVVNIKEGLNHPARRYGLVAVKRIFTCCTDPSVFPVKLYLTKKTKQTQLK